MQLEGGPSATEVKQMPAEFLEEMLELRMRIEEAKEDRDPDRPGRLNLEMQLVQRRAGLLQEAGQQFDRLEAQPPGAAGRTGLLAAIRQTLNATKYIQGLLRDLRED